jgi:hypothetical protein
MIVGFEHARLRNICERLLAQANKPKDPVFLNLKSGITKTFHAEKIASKAGM